MKVTSGRAHFVDLLRLWMSVQMIQGHTIDALLAVELRSAPWFATWTWVRGFTAVGFLTAAGFSFYLSTLSSPERFEHYRATPHVRRRRARRALLLIAIGYLLHAPLGVFSGDVERALHEAQIVDVLQCIGVTLLLLEAMVVVCPRVKHVAWTSLALGAVAIGCAPITAGIDCDAAGSVRFACNYLSRSGGSLFPLLPWSGYMFVGVAVGALAMPRGPSTRGVQTASMLGAVAVLFVLVSFVLESGLAVRGFDADRIADRGAWPPLALSRLGGVFGMAAVFGVASTRVEALPRFSRVLASETLFLYVSHLLVLYTAGVGLSRVIGPALSTHAAIAVAIAMIFVCSLGALGWAELKQRRAMM